LPGPGRTEPAGSKRYEHDFFDPDGTTFILMAVPFAIPEHICDQKKRFLKIGALPPGYR
jgi:hypothetical protein